LAERGRDENERVRKRNEEEDSQETPRSGAITFLTPRFRVGVPWVARWVARKYRWKMERDETVRGKRGEEREREKEGQGGQRGWKMQSLSGMQLGVTPFLREHFFFSFFPAAFPP